MPEWLKEEYIAAVQELAEIGRADLSPAQGPQEVRSILAILAIAKGLRTHATFLIDCSEDELLEIESRI